MSSESTPIQSRSSTPLLEGQHRSVDHRCCSIEKKLSFHQEIFSKVSGSSSKKKNASKVLYVLCEKFSVARKNRDVNVRQRILRTALNAS